MEYNVTGILNIEGLSYTPQIPTGENIKIEIAPNMDLSAIVNSASYETDFILSEGEYTCQNQLVLKHGQRLIGKGRDLTKIKGQGFDRIVYLKDVKDIEILGIEFDCEKTTSKAIHSDGVNGLKIKDCRFRNAVFTSMLFMKSGAVNVKNIEIYDSAGLVDETWVSGNIMIASLKDSSFDNVRIRDYGETSWGYGIKFLDFSGENEARNVYMSNLNIAVKGLSQYSVENEVPNFSIEFYENKPENIVIENSELLNMVSFSFSHYANRPTVKIKGCTIDPQFGESFEVRGSGMEIVNSNIFSPRGANFYNGGGYKMEDIRITGNNIFTGYKDWTKGVFHLEAEIENMIVDFNYIIQHKAQAESMFYIGGENTNVDRLILRGNRIVRTVSNETGNEGMIIARNGTTLSRISILGNTGDNFPIEKTEFENGDQIQATKYGNKEI